MSGRVVAMPAPVHRCAPGWTYRTPDPVEAIGHPGWDWDTRLAYPPDARDYPRGTVWECDCGKTWVSTGPPNGRSPGIVDFRPERRLERRRRLR